MILGLTWPRNSTLLSTPPESYWGQFEEISKYNTHLNVLERLWTAWYAWMQNDVLATGIMSFVMHELVYFGRSLPWIFIDSLGLLKGYKIQNVSPCYIHLTRPQSNQHTEQNTVLA
jgi:methylsterol monooxygenase